MIEIIDTHIHCWNLEKHRYQWLEGNTTLLNKTYQLIDLEEERSLAGITGGVMVQAANHFDDTDAMLEAAANNDWIKGVVGWIPLMHPPKAALALECYGKNPYFKGVRHLIHDEADSQWLLQPAVIESLQLIANAGLTYDLVGVKDEHLDTLLELLQKLPDLKVVLDHLNQPPIAMGLGWGRWADLIKEVSFNKNVYAKVSGLGATSGKGASWTENDLLPSVEFALKHFGVGRCFCGGDWPVSLLAGSYADTWEKYRKLWAHLLTEAEQELVFSKNAIAFYQL